MTRPWGWPVVSEGRGGAVTIVQEFPAVTSPGALPRRPYMDLGDVCILFSEDGFARAYDVIGLASWIAERAVGFHYRLFPVAAPLREAALFGRLVGIPQGCSLESVFLVGTAAVPRLWWPALSAIRETHQRLAEARDTLRHWTEEVASLDRFVEGLP